MILLCLVANIASLRHLKRLEFESHIRHSELYSVAFGFHRKKKHFIYTDWQCVECVQEQPFKIYFSEGEAYKCEVIIIFMIIF